MLKKQCAQKTTCLKKHASKYSYIPMYDYDYKPYDIKYFEKRLKNIEPDKIIEKQKQIKKNKNKLDIFIKSNNISEFDKIKIKTINFFFKSNDFISG